jgi:cell wall-associated NlpC family hydrolase
MPTLADIQSEALSWLDTPFHHQARAKGIGVDCAGIVTMAPRPFGLSNFDITNYARLPQGPEIRRLLDEHMDPVALADARGGDVVLFAFKTRRGDIEQHLGILIDDAGGLRFVHAWSAAEKVVSTALDVTWRRRRTGAWRYRGLD